MHTPAVLLVRGVFRRRAADGAKTRPLRAWLVTTHSGGSGAPPYGHYEPCARSSLTTSEGGNVRGGTQARPGAGGSAKARTRRGRSGAPEGEHPPDSGMHHALAKRGLLRRRSGAPLPSGGDTQNSDACAPRDCEGLFEIITHHPPSFRKRAALSGIHTPQHRRTDQHQWLWIPARRFARPG